MDKVIYTLGILMWIGILAYIPTACDKEYAFQQERIKQFKADK